jgi:hypothetical protein
MKFNQINTLVANLNAVIGSQESKTQKKLFRIYRENQTSSRSVSVRNRRAKT